MEEAGQEKYATQLDELAIRLKELEQENRGLKTRLDAVLNRIDATHEKAFPSKNKSMSCSVKYI